MSCNPWRGELVLKIGSSSITLRCTMNVLAKLLNEFKCDSLVSLCRKWDSLNPEIMEKTLRLVADNPKDADEFFKSVNGLNGLERLQDAFYRIISGYTPDEIREEEEARKKLEMVLKSKSAQEIITIVTALQLK